MTGDPHQYARSLAERVSACCDGALRGAYLHGSAALGGWVAERSDVDILFIAADDIAADAMTAVAGLLAGSAADCPGHGLECSVVRASHARRPAPPWPFILHTGPEAEGQQLVWGEASPGDPDLLMHYAVCRAAGVVLTGPPPGDCIGPVPRPVILTYLADELGWGLANAPESYSVLNACRALAFLAEGRIVSKVAGGRAALDSARAPAGLVRRALDQQQARSPARQPGPDAVEFVQEVAVALRDAASRPAAGDLPA